MEGVALLRAYAGEHDREFTLARIAEIRRLLAEPALAGEGVTAVRASTVDVYRTWSASYDEPRNTLFDAEEPYLHEILGALPPGDALDAACGTGRYAGYLAARGHRVVGTDTSAEMLARARARVPAAAFTLGDLRRLPLAAGSVDTVVCALALTHVPDLRPVLGEFARVLRPGGHLVISDAHHLLVELGSVPRTRTADGRPGLVPAHRHLASDYLSAALPLGLQLRRCEEPRQQPGDRPLPPPADPVTTGEWDDWPWSLMSAAPAAVRAAFERLPVTVIWHFQLAG